MTKVTFPRIRIRQKRILTIQRISNLPKMYEVQTLSNLNSKFVTSLLPSSASVAVKNAVVQLDTIVTQNYINGTFNDHE